VAPEEVEETTGEKYVLSRSKTVKGEKRWRLLGRTAEGRYLAVIFTVRSKMFRAITAYDMNATERKTYASKVR
jgi:uncharacterized DUF497 family protein